MNMHVGARRSRAHTPAVFVQVTPELIRQLAAIVEAGIELLDEIGGDPDLEPDGTEAEASDEAEDEDAAEPLLGASEGIDHREAWFQPYTPATDGAEPACEDEGAQCDDDGETDRDNEPSLGWTDAEVAAGAHPLSGLDVDREADADDEPSLGAPERANVRSIGTVGAVGGFRAWPADGTSQLGWAAGGRDDGEAGDDNGIADPDGMIEQFGGLLKTLEWAA